MWYRLNADDYMWEILDDKNRLMYKTLTEEEAKKIIEKGGL